MPCLPGFEAPATAADLACIRRAYAKLGKLTDAELNATIIELKFHGSIAHGEESRSASGGEMLSQRCLSHTSFGFGITKISSSRGTFR